MLLRNLLVHRSRALLKVAMDGTDRPRQRSLCGGPPLNGLAVYIRIAVVEPLGRSGRDASRCRLRLVSCLFWWSPRAEVLADTQCMPPQTLLKSAQRRNTVKSGGRSKSSACPRKESQRDRPQFRVRKSRTSSRRNELPLKPPSRTFVVLPSGWPMP